MIISTTARRPAGSLLIISILLLLEAERSILKVKGRVIDLVLTVASAKGKNVTHSVGVEEEALHAMGLTKEEVERSLIKPDAQGKVHEVIVGTHHIPLEFNTRNNSAYIVYYFNTLEGIPWVVTRANFTNITVGDFKDDLTLKPLEPSLDWSLDPEKPSSTINITVKAASLDSFIQVDDEIIFHHHSGGHLSVGQVVQVVPSSGIHLRVLNPYTRRLTLSAYFNTETYFSDKEMTDTIAALREGRVVLLTTYYDASGRLEKSSREFLTSVGSFAARHLKFRDCWAWVWVVGGEILGESLVTNKRGIHTLPKPLQLEVILPALTTTDRLCDNWPSDKIWDKRRHFCDSYDGYGDLCSCERPYTPKPVPKMVTWRENIGVVILASTRARYLYRLLKQVLEQPGVTREHLLISVDGFQEETIKLLEVLSLEYRVHVPEGIANGLISRHLRFALFKILDTLPMQKFIVLEEDLLISPDFYSYMQQTSVILDKDPTVYCISAYNHFSYKHTSRDPTHLIRVNAPPALGWMENDWDYWMRSGLVTEGRENILPEISRTSHGGYTGVHVSSHLTKKIFSDKPFSSNPNAIVNTTTVDLKETERHIEDLLKRAKLLNVVDPYSFQFPKSAGEVGLAFAKVTREEDMDSFKLLGDALNIWNQDTRGHHRGLWHFPYYNATLLIMGIPYSEYRKYYQRGYNIVEAHQDDLEIMLEDFNDDIIQFSSHKLGDEMRILNLLT